MKATEKPPVWTIQVVFQGKLRTRRKSPDAMPNIKFAPSRLTVLNPEGNYFLISSSLSTAIACSRCLIATSTFFC